MLAPFESRGMVVTDNAAFEMTANFFTAQFGMPAVTPGRQEMERTELPEGGASYVFRNKDPNNLMPFLLGATQFQVRREAKVVVHGGRRPFTLSVDSTGRVSVIDAKGDRRDGSRYQVREGTSILTP